MLAGERGRKAGSAVGLLQHVVAGATQIVSEKLRDRSVVFHEEDGALDPDRGLAGGAAL